MEEEKKMVDVIDGSGGMSAALNGFSPAISTRIHWNSRKRSAGGGRSFNKVMDDSTITTPPPSKTEEEDEKMQEAAETNETPQQLSERRRALFEPLEPTFNLNGKRMSAESLLPPPDFDAASYPKGWLIGKKRKLVNVDVVESMRRIAVQEMNRKDREIDGLNEQLEEDSRVLEHLQLQLLQEKSKRSQVERENTMLHEQVNMLMNMLQENEAAMDGDGELGDEEEVGAGEEGEGPKGH
ncbi:unnamed protein product [Linum trigynum]|uniref:Protein HEADING DATE REPRESSOR 1 n=1 Tax=Linum trigynum TaxID=586398 RepID=A0AAV2DTX5_9ROSI